MQFVRKYGTAAKIRIPVVKAGSSDFAVGADWTPAAGDVKISKDGGAAANITTLPTAIAMGNGAIWEFSISATEMQAAEVTITVVDAATKAVQDQALSIISFGHASAGLQIDWSDAVRMGLTALPNAAAGANGGLPLLSAALTVASALSSDETQIVHAGTLQSATSTTAVLAAGASATNSVYNGQLIRLTGGLGAGQVRVITAYNGGTKSATISRAWAVDPDATSTYVVLVSDAPAVDSNSRVTVGTNSDKTNYGLSDGAITSAKFAAGAIDNAAIAADAIGSSELAATAVNEIRDAVLDRVVTGSGYQNGSVALLIEAASTAVDILNDSGDGLVAINGAATAAATDAANTFARLGAPAGVSVSADIAQVKTYIDTEVAAIISTLAAGVTLTSAYDFAKGNVAMLESYAANGAAPTPVQAFYALHQALMMHGPIITTNWPVLKLDGVTVAFNVTLNDATSPTSAKRT